MRTQSPSCCAYVAAVTRVELLAVLAGLGLFSLIVIPSLAESGNRSERLVCLNNLGQIGRAYQMWSSDHDGFLPFQVAPASGGIQAHPMAGNIYFQVALLSNELRTASVLVCPSDSLAQRATNFSAGAGGLLNPGFQNNAVSYFVTHAWDGLETGPLGGDRNLDGNMGPSGCSYFLTSLRLEGRLAAWRDTIHMSSGNVLYQNGAAEQTGNSQLRTFFMFPTDNLGAGDRTDYHLVMRSQ